MGLQRLEGQKIVVLGDVGLDSYLKGSVVRLSPEAPVPILNVEETAHHLGMSANVAYNIQQLGGRPYLFGTLGDDSKGKWLLEALSSKNISSDCVCSPERFTTEKVRVLSKNHHLVRLDYETPQSLSSKEEEQLVASIEPHITDSAGVVLEDYGKGVLASSLVKRVISLAKKASKPLFLDPCLKSSLENYEGVDYITPNKKEAYFLSHKNQNDSLEEVASELLKRSKCQHVIITLGSEGLFYYSKKESWSVPTMTQSVFDVTGAGDTVIATLALSIVSGFSMKNALKIANIAAGYTVGQLGCATCPKEVLEKLIENKNIQ